jgi:hypothetical protein
MARRSLKGVKFDASLSGIDQPATGQRKIKIPIMLGSETAGSLGNGAAQQTIKAAVQRRLQAAAGAAIDTGLAGC